MTDLDDSNIRGRNGIFSTDLENFHIPTIPINDENLTYYNAQEVSFEEVVEFPEKQNYPLWEINIGNNYFKGGGV